MPDDPEFPTAPNWALLVTAVAAVVISILGFFGESFFALGGLGLCEIFLEARWVSKAFVKILGLGSALGARWVGLLVWKRAGWSKAFVKYLGLGSALGGLRPCENILVLEARWRAGWSKAFVKYLGWKLGWSKAFVKYLGLGSALGGLRLCEISWSWKRAGWSKAFVKYLGLGSALGGLRPFALGGLGLCEISWSWKRAGWSKAFVKYLGLGSALGWSKAFVKYLGLGSALRAGWSKAFVKYLGLGSALGGLRPLKYLGLEARWVSKAFVKYLRSCGWSKAFVKYLGLEARWWSKALKHGKPQEIIGNHGKPEVTILISVLLDVYYNVLSPCYYRCVLIAVPKKYPKVYTGAKTIIIITAIWAFSIFLMLIPLLEIYGHLGYNNQTDECDFMDDTPAKQGPRKLFLAIGFLLPCVVIIASYSYIFYKARQSSAKVQARRSNSLNNSVTSDVSNRPSSFTSKFPHRNSRPAEGLRSRDIRIARTIGVIFLAFLICCMPVSIVHYLYWKIQSPSLLLLLHPLYWAQYCINIFIYVFMNRQYRDAYVNYISRWWPDFRELSRRNFKWKEEPTSDSGRRVSRAHTPSSVVKFATRKNSKTSFRSPNDPPGTPKAAEKAGTPMLSDTRI
nr:uncharacterized protein LOC113828328 [Penaeus vannamei]